MQGQDMTANAGEATGKKPKDDRNNPIEQSATTVDNGGGNPAPVGTPPRPPYDGPPGGGDYERE